MSQELLARDGFRARDNGEWGKEKLAFLDKFGPPALAATRSMLDRHYLDLFAGPGMNRVKESTDEFLGSPLRALQLVSSVPPASAFTRAWFINSNKRDHLALSARVEREIDGGRSQLPRERVHVERGDANALIYGVLDQIHPRSYVFAFADPDSPKQLRWTTVSALKTHREHESVDLYMLLPLGMAISRLVSRNPRTVEEATPALNGFYGDDRWRSALKFRASGSDADGKRLALELLETYLGRLREHWAHAEAVGDIRRGENHKLYKMLFASDNDAGKKIANWAKKRSPLQTSFL